MVQDPAGARSGTPGVVRTIPWRPRAGVDGNFTFAASSCMLMGRPAPALRVAAAANPVFFGMLGDMGYVDTNRRVTQDYALYVQQFASFLRHPDAEPLLAKTALVGMQDDHDYGFDDCDRTSWKPYTARAFADLVPGAVAEGVSYRRW